MVRYEAENCPQVVRADIDITIFQGRQTQYMPQVPDIPQSSQSFLPEEEWIHLILDSFSELRLVSLLFSLMFFFSPLFSLFSVVIESFE